MKIRLFVNTIIATVFLVMIPESFSESIKSPNVAGQFYPAQAEQLAPQVDSFLKKAPSIDSDQRVEVLVAPHAGYVYSGGVAGYAYKAASSKDYSTVVIIAPSHYYPFNGFSIWESGAFETPLGDLEVDAAFANALIKEDETFAFRPEVFNREHSLEVQLPFLQRTFHDFKIVPIIAGQPDFEHCQKFAQSLNKLIGERKDVLVVISSDMSHFHDDSFAKAMDGKTIQVVKQMQAKEFWQGCKTGTMEMCGFVPVTVGILLARVRGLHAEILKYANSADVTGDRTRVVGYGAVMFYDNLSDKKNNQESENIEGIEPLSLGQKRRLIQIAKQTIHEYIKTGKINQVEEKDVRLKAREGAFVTIHKQGSLRGCIGNIVGRQPLYLTVRDMAIAASSQDPRFPPVTEKELDDIDIEVSVLSAPRVTSDVNEIVMGKHGVIVSRGFQSGVFLPQVGTETGWSREQFLSNLCAHKAGLPPDAWKDPRTKIQIFTADVFSEDDIK